MLFLFLQLIILFFLTFFSNKAYSPNKQLNIHNFLYGDLRKEMFMIPPPKIEETIWGLKGTLQV